MGYDDPWDKAIDARQGPLDQLLPGLWHAWSVMASPPLPRNMAVARLPDGGLMLHSVVCLPESEMAKLDAAGPVRLLVVPNMGHRVDIRRYKARYPDARVIAPQNAIPKVEEVIAVDGSCEGVLPQHGITCHKPDGMLDGYELVYQVPLEGGGTALMVNDVIGRPHSNGPGGVAGWFNSALGPPKGLLGQPRIVRWRFCSDTAAFRGFVERLAALDDVRAMTLSHGDPVVGDVGAALRDALTRL